MHRDRHGSGKRIPYRRAQDQVTTYLSDKDYSPLAKMLKERLASLDPKKCIAFLTRVAVMSPGLYHMRNTWRIQGVHAVKLLLTLMISSPAKMITVLHTITSLNPAARGHWQ